MVSAAGPMLAHLVAEQAKLDPFRLQDFITSWKQQMMLTLFLAGAGDLAAFRRVEARIDGAVITPQSASSDSM